MARVMASIEPMTKDALIQWIMKNRPDLEPYISSPSKVVQVVIQEWLRDQYMTQVSSQKQAISPKSILLPHFHQFEQFELFGQNESVKLEFLQSKPIYQDKLIMVEAITK